MSSLKLSDARLAFLIEGGESAEVEFKRSLEKQLPAKIGKSVCAFANDIGGSGNLGVMFIGIDDNGEPAGIDIDDRMLLTLADMSGDGNIVPPPTLLVDKRSYKGGKIVAVTVLPSRSPPVRYKGVIHVRHGPRLDVANAHEETLLNERRRHGDCPFDVLPIPDTGIGDIDRKKFEDEYLPAAVSRETLLANDRSFAERLTATKMMDAVDGGRATVLGLLVLGIRPRDFIPGAYVQFLRIAGGELSDEIVDEMAIDGTITDILGQLDIKLRAHNHQRVDIVSGPRERRTQTYPIAALQQLVYNALMHRTYEGTNAPVRVVWFDGRIEILSPGGPFGIVTKENFSQPGIVDYRNPGLAEAMKALGYVQRFGIGIKTARKLLADSGHPDIEFTVESTHLLATVREAARPEQTK